MSASDLPSRPPGAVRHCWVVDPPGRRGRYPGLLYLWRRTGGVWTGLVIYVYETEGEWRLAEAWVSRQQLSPVHEEPG